jgi:hypothetical protein
MPIEAPVVASINIAIALSMFPLKNIIVIFSFTSTSG